MSLRSSTCPLLQVQRTRTEYGSRASNLAVPAIWNKLSTTVLEANSLFFVIDTSVICIGYSLYCCVRYQLVGLQFTLPTPQIVYNCTLQIKARGYAYAKIEYVSVRTYLSKIEYAHDTFRTLNSIQPDLSETFVYPFTPVQLYRPTMR